MTNLSIDGSSLLAETLSLDSINHSVTNKANGELNDLTVSFESLTPINSMGFCYVKYTLPPEYNLTKFDTDDIVASGMFVDGNGKPVTSVSEHNFEDESDPEKWVIIFGCNFDPEEKTSEELSNFKQNFFEVSFNNVINPWLIKDTSEMKIEVFKKWNSKLEQLE